MRFVPFITVCLFTLTANAQSGVDTVLQSVQRNNQAIRTAGKYYEARRLEFRTGLTPYDPFVEYDYMLGSPASAGNQRDFSVTQRLDFPTTYRRRRTLSSLQQTQTELQHRVQQQQVLLDAKLVTLDLIYLNKKGAELARRVKNMEQLAVDYQRKLDKGEAIILDVNKARVQLLNVQQEMALNQNERKVTLTRIAELNGGIPIEISDTLYPAQPVIPSFEKLDSIIEANDPELKVLEQEQGILRQQIDVQRSLNLPKIEAGYHAQGILGQSYRGAHAGISIPLWENKNRLRAAQANLEYAVSQTSTRRLEHRLENRQLYEQLEVRRSAMTEYSTLLPSLNNTALLNKALRLGQITVIQYFQDESFYFTSYDRFLQLEREYYKAVAQLYKYTL